MKDSDSFSINQIQGTHPTSRIKHLTGVISVLFGTVIRHKNLSEIGWLVTGQVVTTVLGFFSMKLLSSMGTSEFGIYSLVLTIAAFVSASLYGPAEQGFIRFYYNYSNEGKARTYIGQLYRYLVYVGCSLMGITFLVILLNSRMKTIENAAGVFTIGLFVIIFNSSAIYNSLLNVLRKRKTNTIIQIIEKSLIILFLFLLIQRTRLTANAGLMAIIAAMGLVIIAKTKVLNRYVPKDLHPGQQERKKNRKDIAKVVATFGLPFAIWGITGWLQSNSERWIIAKYLSTANVGIFSLMAVLANYMVVIPAGIIGQFAQPIIYEKISSKDALMKAAGHRVFMYFVYTIIALVIFSSIFSAILGKEMILLVSNKDFISNWHILPLLCFGLGLFTIGQTLTILGLIKNVPKIYLLPKIFTGIFAVISNIFFIIEWELMGAAVSICITSFIYLVFVVKINEKLNKNRNLSTSTVDPLPEIDRNLL